MDNQSPWIPPARLLAGEVTHEVIGAFYDVYNAFGFGFLEKVYARALAIQLERRGLRAQREVFLRVHYEGQEVGIFRADFVVEDLVILELKTKALIGHRDRRQLLHYLRATNMRLGLVMNFGPKPTFLRVINS